MVKINKTLIIYLLLLFTFHDVWGQKFDIKEIKSEDEFRWGVRAFNNGFFNKAIISFEKSINIKPQSILPRVWLGKSYYKSGYVSEALKEWEEVLSMGGGDELLRFKRDTIVFRNGLGKELRVRKRYVLSHSIDANIENYYPFRNPTAITSKEDGSSYVVCFGSNEILEVDVNDKIVKILKGGLQGFDHPFDIIKIDKYLYVSEYEGNRIVKLTLDGKRVKSFGLSGNGKGQLLGPQFLATDGSGYIYVTDWGNSRVSKYDLEGNFILSFYSHLYSPTGIAVTGGKVYVADNKRHEIIIFDESGNYIDSVGKDFLTKPEGISVEKSGNLLVADSGKIVEYDIKREKWNELLNPDKIGQRITDVTENPNGDIIVTDFNNSRVYYFSEISQLYSSFLVTVEKIDSISFPNVFLDVSVQDRYGNPIVGLKSENFHITESYRDVEDLQLVISNTDSKAIDIVVLTENSLEGLRNKDQTRSVVGMLYDKNQGKGSISVVSTEKHPVLRGKSDMSRLKLMESAVEGDFSPEWRFDLGTRMAVSQLVSSRNKKAIIYLSTGKLNNNAFKEYSLENLANYMKNNYVVFYPVYLDKDSKVEELTYLAGETGGKEFWTLSSKGIKGIYDTINSEVDPVYVLSYVSSSESEFGRKYIPVEVTVTLQKKGGREVSGYYAPLKF